MAKLQDIVSFLDEYLDAKNVKDNSWNGLQVEGGSEITKVMCAVDAGMEAFKKAAELGANMVVVHHGMFWKGVDPRYIGYTKKRIDFLVKHGISLYASHLPLDKHLESGNNVQLLKLLDLKVEQEFCTYEGEVISVIGRSKKTKTIEEIQSVLEKELGATCKVLPFGKKEISTIAICSGGGANYAFLGEAIEKGVDLYLTGDSTEMYHLAKDVGINIVFAGHHATETVGVKALADVIEDKFGIDTVFVDIPTGL